MTRDEAIAILIAYGTAQIDHDYLGDCPEPRYQEHRANDCFVCQALKRLEEDDAQAGA